MRGTASWALVVGLMVGFAGGAAILHEHVAPLVAEPAPARCDGSRGTSRVQVQGRRGAWNECHGL